MLVDTQKESPGILPQVDVCIIGSGPAGLTIARELSRSGQRVCILESGGQKLEADAQDLNKGMVDSPQGYREQTLREGRRRQFGGSAHLWNHELRGESTQHIRYVSFDEIDFEHRDWIPESGWPFDRSALLPFYEHAQEICGIGSFEVLKQTALAETNHLQPWTTERLESAISQFGSSDIFLDTYRQVLSKDTQVTIILHAVLLEFEMDSLSRTITGAQVAGANGKNFTVQAKRFILAAGGLENARILLLQEKLQPGGLGNQNDMVGRCYMDHPSLTLGTLTPHSTTTFAKAAFYDQHNVAGHSIMGKLHIRPEIMRREKMLNICAVLVPHFKNLRSNIPDVLRQLFTKGPRFIWQHFGGKQTENYSAPANGEAHQSMRQRLLQGYYGECFCGWSRLNALENRFNEFGVRSLVEQSPDRSNRIVLQEERDGYNQRKTKVIWRWNEVDLRSIRRAQEIFAGELASFGRFTPVPENAGPQPRLFYSPHHFMGTTRMHTDPKNGVVNADGRVHDVSNLYVAGSSVFPTSGFANPTFTMIALALRLAKHLQTESAS